VLVKLQKKSVVRPARIDGERFETAEVPGSFTICRLTLVSKSMWPENIRLS
jgi:hypothetical protein